MRSRGVLLTAVCLLAGACEGENDETLFLTASAPENKDVLLQCDASTDQGPWGRTAGTAGSSSCTVDEPLEDLARR